MGLRLVNRESLLSMTAPTIELAHPRKSLWRNAAEGTPEEYRQALPNLEGGK